MLFRPIVTNASEELSVSRLLASSARPDKAERFSSAVGNKAHYLQERLRHEVGDMNTL
jgi:hypothetical protein